MHPLHPYMLYLWAMIRKAVDPLCQGNEAVQLSIFSPAKYPLWHQ